jgi:hypothetical protein
VCTFIGDKVIVCVVRESLRLDKVPRQSLVLFREHEVVESLLVPYDIVELVDEEHAPFLGLHVHASEPRCRDHALFIGERGEIFLAGLGLLWV